MSTTLTVDSKLSDLIDRTSKNCGERGASIVQRAEEAARSEILWLQYLSTQVTDVADCLLAATSSAVREVAACNALGLVRPALGSLRLQIDLALGWLYFKDHRVEWERVQETGDGFKLKKELLQYLETSFPRYRARFGILLECKTRTQADPYRLLSAHLHGQAECVLPQVQLPVDIVGTELAQDEVLLLQRECSEFIGDIFWAVYADQWASLPDGLKTALETRFKTPTQRAAFFSSTAPAV